MVIYGSVYMRNTSVITQIREREIDTLVTAIAAPFSTITFSPVLHLPDTLRYFPYLCRFTTHISPLQRNYFSFKYLISLIPCVTF